MSLSRRNFLNRAVAAAAAAVPGSGLLLIELARARAPDEAASSRQRWGLLIDVDQCANGCTACAEACKKQDHEAILFGDLKDPASEISKRLAIRSSTQIRSDLNLNTGVRYQRL